MSWQSIGAMSVLTGLIMTGCGLSPTESLDGILSGDWVWVQSTGGIGGVTLTPASTGETMMLRYLPDEMVDLYVDGQIVRTVRFEARPLDRDGRWDIAYLDPLFGFDSQTATLLADTLVLTDACCDGFTYRFERAP